MIEKTKTNTKTKKNNRHNEIRKYFLFLGTLLT